MSKVEESPVAAGNSGKLPFNATWHHSMLRVVDPKVEVAFYEKHFGFSLICRMDMPEYKFSLYFLGVLPEGVEAPADPTSHEAKTMMHTWDGVLLELTHNYGTELEEENPYVNGNVEPYRGFGHIAVMCKDVYAACEVLDKKGVKFQKKPDEGRMKGLAFALSPSNYWIEIIRGDVEGFTLAQTMLRVKDPKVSVPFYRDNFGMSVIAEKHFPGAKFSLYFLATLPEGSELPDPKEGGMAWMKQWPGCVLELTHNHGTEDDPDFAYHNGNTKPQGFGHIAFLTDDVDAMCDKLEADGVPFKKKPKDGTMRDIAFVLDPDNYWVEIVKRW